MRAAPRVLADSGRGFSVRALVPSASKREFNLSCVLSAKALIVAELSWLNKAHGAGSDQSTEARTWGLIDTVKHGSLAIVVVLIFSGVVRWAFPAASQNSRPPEETTNHAAAETGGKTLSMAGLIESRASSPPGTEILRELHGFYGVDEGLDEKSDNHDGEPTKETGIDDEIAKISGLVDVASGETPGVLIAFVPDPAHTHLALFFDRTIDAIQQAAQVEGCTFDRAVLPWKPAAKTDQASSQPAESNLASQRRREKWPGLLIFRRSEPLSGETPSGPCQKADLFIFIVGERPTAGIQKEQFQRALQIIHGIRALPHAAQADPSTYLLGPTFSGSLFSLQVALRQNSNLVQDASIDVFSGTITNFRSEDWFASHTGANLHFASFQESDNYLINSFAQFACSAGYEEGEIAVLSEDETEYGESASDVDRCAGNKERGPKSSIPSLHFPREVSQVRSAFQGVSLPGDTDPEGRVRLPLNLVLPGNEDDSVPDFAELQTANSQEAVLLALANSLHQHHTKLVLLFATDPMDQLFLAQFLRRAYPPVRVGVTAPDLLLARQGDSLLNGTFGVSAYALVPGIEMSLNRPDSSTLPHQKEIFPSTLSEGQYNATVGLLETLARPTNSRCAKSTISCSEVTGGGYIRVAPYAAYGHCVGIPGVANVLKPAVQLSILGRDGYWLVSCLPDLETRSERNKYLLEEACSVKLPHDSLPHLPASLNFALMVLGLLGFFQAWLMTKGSILSPWELAAQFAPVAPDVTVRISPRSWLVVIGVLSVALPYMILLAARIAAPDGNLPPFPSIAFSIGLTLLLATFLFVGARHLDRRYKNRAASLLVLIGAGALVVVFLVVTVGRPGWMSWLWSSRSLHLTSGVSPVLAFILLPLGFYWWSLYGLRGLVLTDAYRPRLPLKDDLPLRFIRLDDESTKHLRDFANPLQIKGIPLVAITACLLFALVLPDRYHAVQSLEGLIFDRLYLVLLVAEVAVLVWNLAKLILIWGESRRLLMAIDRIPLRDAFQRMDGFPWASLWSPGASTLRESYRYLARQLDNFERLRTGISEGRKVNSWGHGVPPDVLPAIDEVLGINGRLQANIRDANEKEGIESILISDYTGLIESAAKAAGILAKRVLEPEWSKLNTPSAADPPPSSQYRAWFFEDAGMYTLAEESVALTYVSFIVMILIRIRSLVVSTAGVYVFLVLSMTAYPFEPNPGVLSLAVLLFLAGAAVVGYVYAHLHKDATLSKLTNTREGELDLQFWVQIAGVGAIPLLTLLATQLPELNQVILYFLQPAVQALK